MSVELRTSKLKQTAHLFLAQTKLAKVINKMNDVILNKVSKVSCEVLPKKSSLR